MRAFHPKHDPQGAGNMRMMIGELAASLRISPKTLRLYEKRGLIPTAARGENGYRFYGEATVRRARLVVGLRTVGLPLGTIAELVDRTSLEQADFRRELAGLLSERIQELSVEIAVRQGQMDDLEARYLALMETPKDAPGDCVCRVLSLECSCRNSAISDDGRSMPRARVAAPRRSRSD
jgi:DNA-binding transcriptional MerR regulator